MQHIRPHENQNVQDLMQIFLIEMFPCENLHVKAWLMQCPF